MRTEGARGRDETISRVRLRPGRNYRRTGFFAGAFLAGAFGFAVERFAVDDFAADDFVADGLALDGLAAGAGRGFTSPSP